MVLCGFTQGAVIIRLVNDVILNINSKQREAGRTIMRIARWDAWGLVTAKRYYVILDLELYVRKYMYFSTCQQWSGKHFAVSGFVVVWGGVGCSLLSFGNLLWNRICARMITGAMRMVNRGVSESKRFWVFILPCSGSLFWSIYLCCVLAIFAASCIVWRWVGACLRVLVCVNRFRLILFGCALSSWCRTW